ncbi:MAG: glycosyltransferase family 4 protein [Nitrospirota bacterium]
MNQILKDISLTLFFTGGIGLNTWAKVGNLEREIAIYQRLTENLRAVNFVTYGGCKDKQYLSQMGKIGVYPIWWSPFISVNIFHLLFRYWKILMQSDILKTNQISGVEIPIWFKRHFNKKLIVRCGYLHSRFSEQEGYDEKTVNAAKAYERKAFESADIGVVPTEHDRDWVVKSHGIPIEKLRVIPNYVDVGIFTPSEEKKESLFDVVFVGRSGLEKNLLALLGAIAILKARGRSIRLLFIGGCARDRRLKEICEEKRLEVTFLGNIPNKDLPDYLFQSSVFILPSHHEGHPKVLLEAMSCGLPCIGTRVEGIKELITHRKTGYLCNIDAKSIADAIEVVFSDEAMRKKMGENARRYVLENFSVERALKMELEVIREVIAI